eukprot:6727790-Pyramimonas_sp.AAC.1
MPARHTRARTLQPLSRILTIIVIARRRQLVTASPAPFRAPTSQSGLNSENDRMGLECPGECRS